MIAILPIRFSSNTDPNSVWSDTQFQNWMHPAIQYSLGNFWFVAGWGLFDLNYQLFPETIMDDPRLLDTGSPRDLLAIHCVDQATTTHGIDWTDFDIALLWFAQRTDMYGGQARTVNTPAGGTKNILITVLDPFSWFDASCQELGHSLGFQHEITPEGLEYGSPFSVMSERSSMEFLHPIDPRLPLGDLNTLPIANDPFPFRYCQLITGPLLVAAQLYPFPGFQEYISECVLSLTTMPATLKLYALDFARELRGTATNIAALVTFLHPSGKRYFVEFRRGGHGYDQAVTTSLVVHSAPTGRVQFDGSFPVTVNPSPGYLDNSLDANDFTIRLLNVDINNEWVILQVFNGFWNELDNNVQSESIVADGKQLYQMHESGKIWMYTGIPMTGWQLLDDNSDTRKIVASGGHLYQLHVTGKLFMYTGTPLNGWLLIDNNPDTIDIIADGDDLYQMHRTGKIWKYTDTPLTGWELLDKNPDSRKIVASGGNLYQIHVTNKIWKYTGIPITGWQLIDTNAESSDIIADGKDFYQLHTTGKVWIYTGIPLTGWQLLDDNPDTKQIAAAGGYLFQIHNSGKIWKYMGSPDWFELDNNGDSKLIAAAPGILYQMHKTGKIWSHEI